MDDKFIMMNMNDERSKKVAEILGNKICKKIIDCLAEKNEASEKDLADAIGSPINTVEYNLKKLLEVGLVEKTKNFFWSKRGKKIPMYKLAKKHLVISPKSSPTLNALKTIIPIIAVLAVINLIAISFLFPQNQQTITGEPNKFNSLDELNKFLEEHTTERDFFDGILESAISGFGSVQKSADSANEYSTTNIQVEGVDEADIVKNDGKYIYVASGEKVVIINAYPAEDMEILSELKFSNQIDNIFINENKLIIFERDYGEFELGNIRCMAIGCVLPPQEQKTNIYIYDISDRTNPELEDEISVSGNYYDSRMIGNFVYVINNQHTYEKGTLPAIKEDGKSRAVNAEEIYYTDIEDTYFQYTIILAIDITTGEISEKVLLTGSAQTIYVSQENIYTTYTKYSGWGENEESEKTIINKFSIDKDEIKYSATGEIKGHLLNQFSMDEYNENFRVATTIGDMWNEETPSTNNVYILNEDLELIGALENLAPGEKIYSVRFMGEKGYIVTFKKVDPLFVIDLSDSESPEVLGKLKIPGYSDYLHPYDENHIIGIGKEAVDASDELIENRNLDFAWYQGVKIAIFDVTDVGNPIELHKIVIGDRGTDSEALQDHKAFLFDREKELMVLPITLAEIKGEKTKDNQYGDITFQGAYVYNVNLEDGFELARRITHYEENEVEMKSGYYWYGNKNIKRSLYMDDTLYTISNEAVKANELNNDLEEVGIVKF